ncbi:MAG TPA: hypothetical protein VEJ16_12350 [Alphaproteobacteria bacterium]|nr:hypothetical protein [Alphaproteobacteria bacterium]
MTYSQHWKRGVPLVVIFAVAALVAAITGFIVAGLLIVLPFRLAGTPVHESEILEVGAVVGAIVLMPLFVSKGFDQKVVSRLADGLGRNP